MEQSLLFMHRTNMQRLFCIFSDVRTHLKISVCNMMSSNFSRYQPDADSLSVTQTSKWKDFSTGMYFSALSSWDEFYIPEI